jgi:outer membrane receptor protein involved in Fe transport
MFQQKRLFIHIFFLVSICSSQLSFAQDTGVIKGKVMGKNNPLEYVTVTLAKSVDTGKVVNHAVTGSTGEFLFTAAGWGSYQITFSLAGYKTISRNITLTPAGAEIILPGILLEEYAAMLQKVTVTAQKKLVEKTPQGFIINAASDITQAGGTATDLLKNAPTVNVDAEGNITLRGKAPLVLINGRNSTITNLDQLAASSIESIEIINNATARYDADAESGIINIKLKKNKLAGTNGSFSLSAGAGARGRISSSVLLNHKTKKWNLGIGYDNRFAGRTRKINGSRTNYFLPDTYLLTQNRNDKRKEQLQNLKLNIDYAADDKNSFSFEAAGNTEGQDNDESLNTLLRKQNNSFNSNTNRHSLELARAKVAELAMTYNRQFASERRSFTATVSTSLNYDRENTDINSQSLTENYVAAGNPFWERTHNYENGTVSNAIVDYAFPASATGQIEAGYKGTFRTLNADFEKSDEVNGSYIINTGASNTFIFKEQVQAAYIQYSSYSERPKQHQWKYMAGLRAEMVTNNGKTKQASNNFNNQYVKLFPSAYLLYYINPQTYWKLSYGKRINRPGLGQLNPFTDVTDALNPHSGNPNLKPEITHNLELGFNKEWNNFSLSSNLFYRYALNTIRQFAQLQPNGANLTLPINIGNATTFGIENIATVKPAKFYDFNASLSLFQLHINGANAAGDAVRNAFGWYGKLINNFTPWQGGRLQLIGSYNSALATPQGKRIGQYYADLGFQQKIHKKGNARLGITIVDLFNTLKSGYENNTIQFSNTRRSKADTRAIMITFGYSFKSAFKEKIMDNQFSKEY